MKCECQGFFVASRCIHPLIKGHCNVLILGLIHPQITVNAGVARSAAIGENGGMYESIRKE